MANDDKQPVRIEAQPADMGTDAGAAGDDDKSKLEPVRIETGPAHMGTKAGGTNG